MRSLTEPQSIFLDCLRGLSALAVLIGHALTALPWSQPVGTTHAIQTYAVVIFFILSGFLIAYNCMQRGETYRLSEYLIDRFSRIFVAYIPALLFVAVVDLSITVHHRDFLPDKHSIGTFIANVLMLQHTPFDRYFDWLPRFQPFGTGRPFWTIAIEWWLYVLFGLAFFVGRMNSRETLVALMLILPAFAVVLFFTAWESIALVWIAGAAFGITFGTITGAPARLLVAGAALSALSLAALCYRFSRLELASSVNFLDLQLILLTALLFAGLLYVVSWRPIAVALDATRGAWRWLAAISYSLYLTHHTILNAYDAAIGVNGRFGIFNICALSIAVAVLFTWAFDRHYKTVARWIKSWRLPLWAYRPGAAR